MEQLLIQAHVQLPGARLHHMSGRASNPYLHEGPYSLRQPPRDRSAQKQHRTRCERALIVEEPDTLVDRFERPCDDGVAARGAGFLVSSIMVQAIPKSMN